MLYEFKMPDLGEGITEGTVVKWLVSPGDSVKEHQGILEIETDKAIVEVPSPHSGKVVKLNKETGGTVAVGESLLTIEVEGGAVEVKSPATPAEEADVVEAASTATPAEEAGAVEAASPATPAEEAGSVEAASAATPAEEAGSVVGRLPAEESVFAAPKARALGRRLKIDLTRIKGTGPGAMITEADVNSYSKTAPASKPVSTAKKPGLPGGQIERIPIRGVRKAIAKNLRSTLNNAVSVTGMDEADVTELWELRERERKMAKERGIHLTFLPFFIKAAQHALVFHPVLNGSMSEDGTEIIVKKFYNIGVAVDTPEGLMVSVVREVDKKTILELAEELQVLSIKAKERKIALEELKGSSFTISNYGTYGGTFATPIINYPDIAILGTGKIVERPWVHEGKLAIRRILHLSLTFDHRALDGSEAAKFLTRLVQYLEDPARIFIESA